MQSRSKPSCSRWRRIRWAQHGWRGGRRRTVRRSLQFDPAQCRQPPFERMVNAGEISWSSRIRECRGDGGIEYIRKALGRCRARPSRREGLRSAASRPASMPWIISAMRRSGPRRCRPREAADDEVEACRVEFKRARRGQSDSRRRDRRRFAASQQRQRRIGTQGVEHHRRMDRRHLERARLLSARCGDRMGRGLPWRGRQPPSAFGKSAFTTTNIKRTRNSPLADAIVA